MNEIINNLWQNNHDLAIIIVNFLISILMLIINNKYNEYKDSLKALKNCKIKIDNFRETLIRCIGNNNKDLIKEHYVNNFQGLQNIHIIQKKDQKLYEKFIELRKIYDNFLNDIYNNNKEGVISTLDNL